MTTAKLMELSDEPPQILEDNQPRWRAYDRASPRLEALLRTLPQQGRVRIANAIIQWSGIVTLKHLCTMRGADLQRAKNFGRKSLDDLTAALALHGFALIDAPTVHVLDSNALHLIRWISEYLQQLDHLGVTDPARETHERDILTDVMLILDGRPPTYRRSDPAPQRLLHADRCTQIADLVVPTYRVRGSHTGSCTSPNGKRWQAAWDGACIALGKSPMDFRRGAR